ncbi:sugar phosphate isomerase/epimerase [Paenibacillus lycopersici]|uniref:Sugar phosphate isomerase/epimerase n=1 Tax=Paenibacillus lycopersici TaxID=2704462 RepID=A0A6C0G1S8_9BACL|nr:sugar phosphate isomerase/epimerase [Paenibacillus lycopersici]QHT61179.1 sugar phosphate isomerase/epimerase [Paenibacillus lycopersici]
MAEAKPKIAIQARLWGLDRVKREYAAVFDEMIEAGYDGAEGRITLLEDEEGIGRCLGVRPSFSLIALHAGLQQFAEQEGKAGLDSMLEGMARLGSRYLLVSMGAEADRPQWLELAAELSERCASAGIQFAYHNHDGEFADGYGFFDRLAKQYNVKLAADLAWIYRAGHDPSAFVSRYADSIAYVHLKDVAGQQWKELGAGSVPLLPLLPRLDELRLPWWTVEQDDSERPAGDSAAFSRQFLREHAGLR